MENLQNIQYYQDTSNVTSFQINSTISNVYWDSSNSKVQTITTGEICGPNSTVDVIHWDGDKVQGLSTVKYGYGLIPAGKDCILEGKKVRLMGLNFYDIMQHTLNDLDLRFQELKSYNIPFLRINTGEFAAGSNKNSEWRKYLTNPDKWFESIDAVVQLAEKYEIGLIMNLFWRYKTIPDLMKYLCGTRDSLSSWGNPYSNTRKFMREYTYKFINRYKDYRFVYGWEFCNEGNTPFQQVANFDGSLSSYDKAAGGPAQYYLNPYDVPGGSDLITPQDYTSASDEFCSIVKNIDPYGRMISSGAAIPSMREYSIRSGNGSWSDTEMNFTTPSSVSNNKTFFEECNPSSFNCNSTHIYNDANISGWYFKDVDYSPADLIKYCMYASAEKNRMLYLGEFGSVSGSNGNGTTAEDEIQYLKLMIEKIKELQVPVSSLWNYGYLLSQVSAVYCWNVDSSNFSTATTRTSLPRVYQMQEILLANNYFKSL